MAIGIEPTSLAVSLRTSIRHPLGPQWRGRIEQSARCLDGRSAHRSDDTTGGDAGQLALAIELRGDRITIRPTGAANNLTLLVACLAGGGLPGSVVGHWAFDGEDTPILVDDDQKEWPRGFIIVHDTKLAYYATVFICRVARMTSGPPLNKLTSIFGPLWQQRPRSPLARIGQPPLHRRM